MKKLFLPLLILISAFGVSAEITPVQVLNTKLNQTDVAMAVDEDGNAAFYNAFYDYSYEKEEVYVSVYDADFNLVKNMTFKGFVQIASLDCYLLDPYEVVATYNWMAKNDKWCVILEQPIGEPNEWGDYEDTKLVVVDEDGNILGDNTLGYFDIIFNHVTGGKPYALGYSDEKGEEMDAIYTFTGNGEGGVNAVHMATMKGYPNPLRGGQTFTVELPRVADAGTVLVVHDMSGRQILRQRVGNGVEKAVLHHSRLGHGQFVYTVIYGDGTAESGKLLSE